VSPVIVSEPVAWSASVSFSRTMISTLVLRRVAPVSFWATGASLIQVMTNDPVATLLVAPLPSTTW
jgi:hypothetical protein